MRRPALSSFALALVAACTSPTRLADADRTLRARTPALHAVVRTPETFSVITPSDAAVSGLGIPGAIAANQMYERAGESMRTRHQLPDPALRVAEGVAAALREEFRAPELALPPAPAADAEPEAIAARFETGVVLDVRTNNSHVVYFSTDWTHYQLRYGASARLLEAPSGRVLWKGDCWIGGDPARRSPTFEQLVADDAAKLKAKLAAAGAECVRQLRARLVR